MAKTVVSPIIAVVDTDTSRVIGISPQGVTDMSYFPTSSIEPPEGSEPAFVSYDPVTRQLNGFLDGNGGNATLNQSLTSKIWDAYICCLPLNQTTGFPRDFSGKANDAYLRPSYSEASAWANAGYLTTANTAEAFAMLGNAQSTIDISQTHLIFSVVMNAAVPGAEAFNFISFGNGTIKGFQVNLLTTGKLRIQFFFDDGTTGVLGITNGVFVDGTDHTLGIVVDKQNGHVYVFKDGVADTFAYGLCKGKKFTIASGYRAGIGGSVTMSDTGFSGQNGKFKGLHLITPLEMPLNLIQIMRKLSTYSTTPLISTDIIYRDEDISTCLIVAGQSNEAARGIKPSSVTMYGSPQSDAMVGGVAPSGGSNGYRSLWPSIIEGFGREARKWLHVYNIAQGGTSICDCWVGRIRTWSAGQGFVRGSYAKSSDGGLWRSNIAADTAAVTASDEPTGTSNITTSDGIPWIYLRPYTADDVDGVVSYKNTELFDPLDYCSRISTPVAWGMPRLIGLIEFGQTDAGTTLNVTQENYKDAHMELARYWLSQGCDKVYLGLSFYCGAAGADAKYTGTFTPALSQAVSEINDPRVVLGANLRNALGVLPTTPPVGVNGLQGDLAHANDSAFIAASIVWLENFRINYEI